MVPKQPKNSRIVLTEDHGALMFNIPATGLLRGAPGLFHTAGGFLVFLVLFSMLVVHDARKKGMVNVPVVVFLTFFWIVISGLMLVAIHFGRRKVGIAVVDGELSILQVGIFGSKERSWTRDEIRIVRVGESSVRRRDRRDQEITGTYARPIPELQIVPTRGEKFGMLLGRDVNELYWLAWRINEALGIPNVTEEDLADSTNHES